MNRTRAAMVIARRDFTATVFSRTFFFFLLGPLFPLLLGSVFGGIGARVASQTAQPVVAVVMNPHEFSAMTKARDRLETRQSSTSLTLLRKKMSTLRLGGFCGAAIRRSAQS